MCSSASLTSELSGWSSMAYDEGQTHGKLLVIIDKSSIPVNDKYVWSQKTKYVPCVQPQQL
jgi:hypothetical protein